MNILISPEKLHGTVRIPASKSMAHRLLICAALAEGTSVVSGVDMSRDITATMDVLSAFGASFRQDGSTITVTGVGKTRPQAAIRDLKQLPVIRINEADHASFIRFIIFISVHNVLLFRNQTKKKYLPYLPWAAFVALPLPVPRFPAPADP